MKLLMVSGDRSILQGKKSAFWYTLEEFAKHWERIDVICPHVKDKGQGTRDKGQGTRDKGVTSPLSLVLRPFSNVFFHPSPWSLIFQLQWIVKKGRELIRMHHHDVMTIHEYPPFYNGLGGLRLARKTGVPAILEVHHIVGSPRAASCTEFLCRTLSRIVLPVECRRAAAIRCVSKETLETLARWGVKGKKLRIVPSFYLDRAVFASFAASPNRKKYDMVCAGRLVKNKGFTDVLNTVSMLPGTTLLVIGDGPERGRLAQLAQHHGIADRVTFAGWLPSNEEVYRALISAKVFIMNSKSEGGPRVALEAMALGMPVITTRVGVMPDVIQDGVNGVFTDGTPKDIAVKTQQLLADSEVCEHLGTEARRILERFERKTLVREYAEFLAGICNK